ncbi:16S rRNA (guanine(527)-N(7))-methyltransferase RsmG [Leucobacter salsicius]|uniref:16S rRNA (guanine(527)-N(7))-methyltransferase RsmG n=1 Tax=Leucobacter salsicius TaxID=664638 RepID=UPI0038BA4031
MERRCAWLNEQIELLGLTNAEVKRGRVEEFHDAFEVDQVTAPPPPPPPKPRPPPAPPPPPVFFFVEPMERRCAWLNEQIELLGLTNAEVKRGRVEEFHDAFEVDQVTARAVTALKKLVPITAPLLRDGGEMLFLKGASVENEIEAAEKPLRKHRVREISVEELGADLDVETTRVFRAKIVRHG